jgi:hypothetical protein
MRLRAAPHLLLFGWISYLPLLVVLAAVLAVVAGLGKALGAPSLIWHDSGPTQILAGFAAAGLVAHLGMIGYLLDSCENPDQDVAPDVATFGSVARYVIWPVGILLLFVVGGFFAQKETRYHGLGVLIGPLAIFAMLAWFRLERYAQRPISGLLPRRLRGHLVGAVERGHARVLRHKDKPPAVDPGAHAVQVAIVFGLVLLYLAAWAAKSFVPAAVAVCLALALGTSFWGLLRFWMRRYLLLGMGVAILVVCLAGVTRDAAVTGLSDVTFPEGTNPPPRTLLTDQAVLDRWKAGLGEARPPLVVVTTSGGASRSAVWTINVLANLDKQVPGFLRHVRIITGASGGMVGAAHLISALGPAGPTLPIDTILEDTARDSLTAVTRALILPHSERGNALESAWERNTDDRLAMPFRALMDGEGAGWRPSLIYAPLLVEDGRRLIVSNLDLVAITQSLGPLSACAIDCPQATSAVQLFACGGKGLDELKLSTVARLNATFPWVTSAALLTSKPDRRIVDAGYYDNYGVDIASVWIRKNADWIRSNTSGVLLIQIRDGTSEAAQFDVRVPKGPGYFHEWISGLTTPIEGFLKAWDASMSFRNDEQISLLAADPRLDPGSHFFVTEVFEFAGDAPLNWYLNRASIERLKQPLPDSAFASVKTWWAARR